MRTSLNATFSSPKNHIMRGPGVCTLLTIQAVSKDIAYMLLLTCVLASTVVGMAANSWSEQSTVIFESRQIHWHFLGQLEMLVTASKARKMASKAKKCLLYWPPCSHRGLLTIIPMAASTGDSTGCAIHKWQISGKNSNGMYSQIISGSSQ